MIHSELIRKANAIRREKGSIQLFQETVDHIMTGWLAPKARAIDLLCRALLVEYDRTGIRNRASSIQEFGDSETVTVPPPAVGSGDTEFESVVGEHRFENPFVAELRDALVMADSGICLTDDRGIILETVNSRRDNLQKYLLENPRHLFELYRTRRGKENENHSHGVDTVCSLLSAPDTGGGGYSGWVRTTLPRLEAVDIYAQHHQVRPSLLVEHDAPTWKIEWLDLLGYADDIVYWKRSNELRIDRLIVPSVRRIPNDKPYYKHRRTAGTDRIYKSVSPSALRWVQHRARESVSINDKYSDKVFISRSDADRRRIRNREELLEALIPRGFEAYKLTELSVRDQVRLFAGAETVVAPHGAGLANTICAKECSIVEIFGGKCKPTFYMSAAKLDHDYGLVNGDAFESDIVVEPDRVLDVLDAIQD